MLKYKYHDKYKKKKKCYLKNFLFMKCTNDTLFLFTINLFYFQATFYLFVLFFRFSSLKSNLEYIYNLYIEIEY